jgi:hypothetical protein
LSQEKREAILEARAQNKKIAELILQGTKYHEPVEVRGIDNELHTFEVSPMSDADLAELLRSTNVDLKEIGNQNQLAANMQFLQKGAAIVTGTTDVAKALMPMESLKLILRSFELSGLSGGPKAPKPD